MLVLDMRSRIDYHNAHLKGSINIPVDQVDDSFFVKFKEENLTELCASDREK